MRSASASLFCFCCKDTTSPKINYTFLYVSCDSRTFSFKFLNFRTRIARKFLSTEHTEHTEKDFRRMIKATPSAFRPQTSDFILVKDFVQDSSLDVEPVRRSIIKPSPKARYSSAFSVEIFVKDYIFSCLSARNLGGNLHVKSKDLNGPEIYLR